MKLHKFLLSTLAASVVALTAATASADIVLIDFNTSGSFEGGDVTGDLIQAAEPGLAAGTLSFPATFLVPEAQGASTPDAAGLELTINGFTTNDPNGGAINASTNNFGVNSAGSDSATRLDADLGESITISFNRDLYLTNISFNGLSGAGEQFLVNDILIGQDGDTDPDVDFIFSGSSADGTDLTGGGASTDGIFFAAGDTITFAATGTVDAEVSIRDIRVHVPVPEPGSLALLGLLGGVVAIRRRR